MTTPRSLQGLLLDAFESRPGNAAEHSSETSVLDLDEAALLHRDPPAERSRLRTRRFTNGVARWWFAADSQQLCAQITLMRFGDAAQASLAESDSWSELLAGGAAFREVTAGHLSLPRPIRIASITDPDSGHWHALAYSAESDVVVGVAVLDVDQRVAIDRAATAMARQCERLRSR